MLVAGDAFERRGEPPSLRASENRHPATNRASENRHPRRVTPEFSPPKNREELFWPPSVAASTEHKAGHPARQAALTIRHLILCACRHSPIYQNNTRSHSRTMEYPFLHVGL